MTTPLLCLTYLGAALCYAASPSAPPVALGWAGGSPGRSQRMSVWLRGGGWVVLGLSGWGFVSAYPLGAGLLVWLSAAMTSLSVLVIAAPLARGFVVRSSAMMLVLGGLGCWI
jgi:hypothetical protein